MQIEKNMGWCDDPLSKDYNKLIKYPFSYKSENLYKKIISTILFWY